MWANLSTIGDISPSSLPQVDAEGSVPRVVIMNSSLLLTKWSRRINPKSTPGKTIKQWQCYFCGKWTGEGTSRTIRLIAVLATWWDSHVFCARVAALVLEVSVTQSRPIGCPVGIVYVQSPRCVQSTRLYRQAYWWKHREWPKQSEWLDNCRWKQSNGHDGMRSPTSGQLNGRSLLLSHLTTERTDSWLSQLLWTKCLLKCPFANQYTFIVIKQKHSGRFAASLSKQTSSLLRTKMVRIFLLIGSPGHLTWPEHCSELIHFTNHQVTNTKSNITGQSSKWLYLPIDFRRVASEFSHSRTIPYQRGRSFLASSFRYYMLEFVGSWTMA